MMSVLSRVAEDIEKTITHEIGKAVDPHEKLRVFIRLCMEVVHNKREYYQVNMDFWTQINQKKEVRQVIAEHYRKFRAACATIIKEGIEKGDFKKVDAMEYSSFIIAVVDGLSLQWLFDRQIDKLIQLQSAEACLLGGLTLGDKSV